MNLGDAIVSSDAFKQFQKTNSPTRGVIKEFRLPQLKADFTTSAGWDPEDLRTGRVVLDATRPIAVINIIPPGRTAIVCRGLHGRDHLHSRRC